MDFHRYPIYISKHAAYRLATRFQLFDTEEVRHYIKNAKVIVPFGKEGSIGKLKCDLGDRKVVFVCKIKEKNLVILTVEEA